MKKVLLVLSIAVLILALTGCPGWFNFGDVQKMTIPEIIEWIDTNEATDVSEFLVETEGIVTYAYSYYAYIVDAENNGIMLRSDSSVIDFRDFNPGDKISVVGSPYFSKYGEYRLDTDTPGGTATLIEKNVALPDPYVLPAGEGLTVGLFGKLVQLTARYDGTDSYGHHTFNNGGVTVTVFKYSDMPSDLATNTTYTIMGVVGQSYGYKLFVWDKSYVLPAE
ncbi:MULTISPECIES: hypothetical protein [Kosmotoga]|uniref:Nucleic acid binding OB-fold tRNA/helicase-type n=1 Tax=Kosmotoga olearia (strain ATCC BAA-1733 / DSM 21960 / TBF 19.5.1) TaxID=521045 RepID=C5CIC9_KOSOT|nr:MULTISPECIES: hypothetical protein [Kosmotoga]ACR78863.1 hypothetical protein Kole_0137 [Kosmotoga olearia TBF 19.5.1]MDI3524514.1 hypothetical protein [Kosmotoga sp.]